MQLLSLRKEVGDVVNERIHDVKQEVVQRVKKGRGCLLLATEKGQDVNRGFENLKRMILVLRLKQKRCNQHRTKKKMPKKKT